MGLFAKIGYLKTILASRTHLWPNFMNNAMGIVPPKYFGWFLELRKLDFRGLKGQIDVKNANLRGLIVRIGHYRPILATRTHLWSVFMEYVIKIVP